MIQGSKIVIGTDNLESNPGILKYVYVWFLATCGGQIFT